MKKRKIILGIGTGRCGSKSLAALLNKQPLIECGIEKYKHDWYSLNWRRHLREAIMDRSAKIKGDVAFFHLPLVIKMKYDKPNDIDLKTILLVRNKDEFVESVCKRFKDRGEPLSEKRNSYYQFAKEKGMDYRPTFDYTVPKYFAYTSLKDMAARFWEDYNLAVKQHNLDYFELKTQELNSTEKIREALAYIGIPDKEQYVEKIRITY